MKLILFLVLCIKFVWAAPINKTIDELLKSETKKELQISHYDPFKKAQPLLQKKSYKTRTRRKSKIELSAVLNEKAFINGKWYTKGELTSGGRVMKITRNSVYLKDKAGTKILRLNKNAKSMFRITIEDVK